MLLTIFILFLLGNLCFKVVLLLSSIRSKMETITHLELKAQQVDWDGVFPSIILLSTGQEGLIEERVEDINTTFTQPNH